MAKAAPTAKTGAKQKREWEIQQNQEIVAGSFATNVIVSQSEDHFALTFVVADPLQSTAEKLVASVVSRVFVTKSQFRQMASLFDKHVQKMDTEQDGKA